VLTLDPDELRIGFADTGPARYRMIAFMHHHGRWALYGHDIAFVREDDHWIKFDDGEVTVVPNIQRHVVFGRQYLYLYRRIDE
jgi:ubiquitin C-terminal hydrolase